MRHLFGAAVSALFLLIVQAPAAAAQSWHEARTRHFIITGDVPADELRSFAGRLERFDQAVRIVRRMKDPPLTDSNRLKIYVLRHQAAIERLYGGSGVLGFYIPRASGSVAFVPRRAASRHQTYDIDADSVFFHEYAHHLQLQGADVAVPPWLVEGFAEFFGRTELRDDGSILLGVPPGYRAYILTNYAELSLREMLGADTSLSDIEHALIYGRGWLLTHYLTFARNRQGQLDRYVADIQKGVPPLTAAENAFGDLNELSTQLGGYLRRKKLPHLVLRADQMDIGPIAVRPLSTAEVALMPVHLRSERGATKKTKHDIAADARRLASGYPQDAFVQSALAKAEIEAGNFAAADAAASRALAVQPNHLSALILKGRATMELAAAADRAAWDQVRSWFLKANKVDAEAPEPLMLYHQSFVRQGIRPSANAVKGLLYALALVPQDDDLRTASVRQLLTDRRTAEAGRTFAPLAFKAHYRKARRDAASQTMAAIRSGDIQAALAALGKWEKLLNPDD